MMSRRPLLAGLAAVLAAGRAGADTPLAGRWTGVLDAGVQKLRLRLEIAADGGVTLYSLDQGGAPIAARAASLTPARIAIEVPAVRGRYEGRLTGADRMEGTWTQGAGLPLVFLRGDVAEAAAPAAPLTPDRLREIRMAAGSPALIAAVATGAAPARLWVDGERAVGTGVAAATTDRWHIGSITKSMTATLVARLVEQGAVRWDDTVGAVLADVAPRMRAAYRPVTFRHLLSHRSGLPGNIPMIDFMRFSRANEDAREERRRFAAIALGMAPKGPAGATFEYANNGFIVAGAMLEKKTGQRWEDLMRTHVFAPLGLASAGFGAPGAQGRTDEPVGHAKGAIGGRRAYRIGEGVTDNPVVLGPAGTAHVSMADLLTYLAAHRDRTDFLSRESWATLHTPPFGGDYAMGWIVRDNGTLWHNGSNTLWYAEACFNPRAGFAAAAAANDGAPEGAVGVAKALAGAIAAA